MLHDTYNHPFSAFVANKYKDVIILDREKNTRNRRCFNFKWLPEENRFVEKPEAKECTATYFREIKMIDTKKEIRKIARCNSPLPGATDVTYKNDKGCGRCANGTLGVSCQECFTHRCNSLKPIKCYQGSASNPGNATECSDPTASVCSNPVGEASNVSFSCGPCPEGTKGTTCRECVGRSKFACNGPNKVSWEYGCATWAFNKKTGKPEMKSEKTKCKVGILSSIICNRPSYTINPLEGDIPIIPTNQTYTNTNSCGPCNTDSIACADCNWRGCNDNIPIKCFQSKYGTSRATECENRSTRRCRQPTFENYAGFSGLSYGCGECMDLDRVKGRCKTCKGSFDSACNTPPTLGQDYSCYSYTWDGRIKGLRDQYWVTETRCMRLPGVEAICNRPFNSRVKGNYTLPYGFDDKTQRYTRNYVRPSGCGPCPPGTQEPGFETCFNCTGEFCNKLPWEQDGGWDNSWESIPILVVCIISILIFSLFSFLGVCVCARLS